MSKQEPFSPRTATTQSRLRGAEVTQSVCPYCAIGCGLLVFTKAQKVFVKIRPGTDIPFLGGITRYILEHERYFYAWLPKIDEDLSEMSYFVKMHQGRIRGTFLMG
jgi:anaerobic selenocysteine-containing dehydrogenase